MSSILGMHPRDARLLSRFLIGGAAAGSSAALLTGLLAKLNEAKAKEETSRDDDTLYVNLPTGTKRASQPEPNFLVPGAAMAGGVLASIGSYALIRRIMLNKKREQMQKELDEAQRVYMGELGELTTAKTAASGKSMGMSEVLFNSPVAAGLLLSLAAAAVTNKMLDRSFPLPKAKGSDSYRPKRVVVRSANSEVAEDIPDEEALKSASEDPDAMDYALRVTALQPSAYTLRDLLCAAATQPLQLKQAAHDAGLMTAIDLFRGLAKTATVNSDQLMLASGWLTRDALLAPQLGPILAGELHDATPMAAKLAAMQDDETKNLLSYLAARLSAEDRAQHFEGRVGTLSKSAAAVPEEAEGPGDEQQLAALLLQQLQAGGEVADQKPSSADEVKKRLGTQTFGVESNEDSQSSRSNSQSDEQDDIDAFLGQSTVGAVAGAAHGAQKQVA